GSAFLALECFVPGYVRICLAGWVVCDAVEPAVGARPFLTRPHGEVRHGLDVWAQPVEECLGCFNVSFVVEPEAFLCFRVTGEGGVSNTGLVFVRLGWYAETVA